MPPLSWNLPVFVLVPELDRIMRCEESDRMGEEYAKSRDWRVLARRPPMFDETRHAAARKALSEAQAAFGSAGWNVAMWIVAARPSVAEGTRSLDLDMSEDTLEIFREWLRREYRDIEALNRQWGTRFVSWHMVRPETADECLARNFPPSRAPAEESISRPAESGRPGGSGTAACGGTGGGAPDRPGTEAGQGGGNFNFSAWADHKAFMDWAMARVLVEYRDALRESDPAARVGAAWLPAPAPYGGHDPDRLDRSLDALLGCLSDIRGEIFRSFSATGWTLSALNALDPDAERNLWLGWLRGDSGALISLPPDHARVPEWLARASAELNGGITFLRDLCLREDGGVILYWSPASARVMWMLDAARSAAGGRGRTMDGDESGASRSYQAAISSWAALLRDIGIPFRFAGPTDLLDGRLKRRTRILILPRTVALSDEEAAAIREWLLSGRLLVADFGTGTFDGRGKRRDVGALDDVFGIERLSAECLEEFGAWRGDKGAHLIAPLDPVSGVSKGVSSSDLRIAEPGLRALGARAGGTAACGAAAMLSKATRHGRARYLNLFVSDYSALRSSRETDFAMKDETAARNYRGMYGEPRGGEGIRWAVSATLREGGAVQFPRVLEGGNRIARNIETALFRSGEAFYAAVADVRPSSAQATASREGGLPLADGSVGSNMGRIGGERVLKLVAGSELWWYDVRAGKELGFGASTDIKTAPGDVAFVGALPYRVSRLVVRTRPVFGRGVREREVTAVVTTVGGAKPGLHVLRASITGRDGVELTGCAVNVKATEGMAQFTMGLPADAPPGLYDIRVRDAASGAVAAAERCLSADAGSPDR